MSDYIDILQREDDMPRAASRKRNKRKAGKKTWNKAKFERCVKGVKRSNKRRKRKANPWAVCNAAKKRKAKKTSRRLTKKRKSVHTSASAGETTRGRRRKRQKRRVSRRTPIMAKRRKKSHKAHGHRKSPKRVAAGKKAARTRARRKAARRAHAAAPRRRRRRHAAAAAAEAPRRSRRRKRPGHKRHHVKGYRRKGSSRRKPSWRRGYAKPAKRGRYRRKGAYVKPHMSHETRRRRRHSRARAMSNPITIMDGVVGGVCGLVGYGASEVVDRLLAAHALKDTGNKDANGVELYSDPTDKSDGTGHWNPTYILGPMSLGRWAAGLGMGILPLVAGGYIKSSGLRSCVQFFGFGALIRTGGKGLSDLLAWVSRKTEIGQRLFAPEMSAQAALNDKGLVGGDVTPPGIAPGPTGFAGLPQSTGGCGNAACQACTTGVGSCVTMAQVQLGTAQQAAGVPTTAPTPQPPIPMQPGVPTPNVGAVVPGPTANLPPPNPAAGIRGGPLGTRGLAGSPTLYNPAIRRVVEG